MSRTLSHSIPRTGETVENRPLRPALGMLAGGWGPQVLLVLVMLAAAFVGTLPLTYVPPVVPATAPAAVFSAARAMQDLAHVAAAPHPVGSPANAAVRDYLLAQIAALGLQAEVQRTTVSEISPLSGIAQVTPVENVLVRLPGTQGAGKAVLLTGHYDSVPTTPGAGDCGSCAVEVLETLRAIVAGPPLPNDVIFLFTDAEELGIVGATAFMREHPWAGDVGLAIVLEGLGTHGSALLYAASPNHGEVVRAAFDGMASPGGFAYFHDVMWKVSGNSGSDLDAFVAGGVPGLAFVHLALDGSQAYHSGADNVQTIDPRTIQQHGAQALSLVRHFGSMDLGRYATGADAYAEADAVYFSLLPNLVVRYPGAWAQPLATAAALLVAGALVYGRRRKAFTLPGLLGGMAAMPLALVVALAATTGVWWLLRLGNPNLHMYSVGGWYGATWTTAGLVLLSLGLVGALQALWRLRLSAAALAAGGLLWYAILAVLLAPGLPGFGYLFSLPLFVAAPAAAFLWSGAPAAQRPWLRAAVLALPAAAAILLATPVVYGLAVFAGRMEAMMGLPLAALPVPFVIFAGALLAQGLDFLAPVRRWRLPAALLAAALICLGLGWLQSGFDTAHPKLNTIVYRLDADTQAAQWITVNDSRSGRGTGAQLDAWTGQFFADGATPILFNPWASGWFGVEYPALAAPAPVVTLPRTQVQVLNDSPTADGGRLLQLELTPAEGVQDLFVQVQSDGGVRLLALNGEAMGGQDAPSLRINVNGAPTAPVTFELRAAAGSPVRIAVEARRLGLPAVDPPIAPRPAWMAAAPFNDVSDSTLVAQTVTIQE